MANNVVINYSKGGLGTPAVGEDFISGLIIYSSVYPSGFSAGNEVQEIFSVTEAEALGITNTSIGETQATGTMTITGSGATGAIITAIVSTSVFGDVTLGSYTVVSTDTLSTIATNLTAAINANTNTNGFSASVSGAVITVTAPAQTGVGGNSFVFLNTYTLGATATVTGFSGGVASVIDAMHYHIAQYFALNPTGDLWLQVTTGTSAVSSYSEIVSLQNASNGKIRQMGIYEPNVAFSTSNISKLQAQATINEVNNKPLEIFYAADFTSVSNLTSLSDLTLLNGQNVSVMLGQDGGNTSLGGGYRLWLAYGKSITCLGAFLGTVSAAAVNQSPAWVGQFNMTVNGELDTIAFANGAQYASTSDGLISNIDAKGYTFLRKFVGIGGSYFNNDYTAIAYTSDYSTVHLNRTIHKAARNVRGQLLPSIASPVYFNADGSIALYSITHFQDQAKIALAQMVSAGEISQYAVIINAKQNVLSTKTLTMQIEIVPVGVANKIIVNLGFVLNIG